MTSLTIARSRLRRGGETSQPSYRTGGCVSRKVLMTQTANFVAADLGASSGRIMLGAWDGRAFSVHELHRFANSGVHAGDGLYWDILGIWSQIRIGLTKYRSCYPEPPHGIGCGRMGSRFRPVGPRRAPDREPPPLSRSQDGRHPALLCMSRFRKIQWFAETGVQTMPINTLFQLYSMVRAQDPALASAETLLMIPDLCTYFLCGEKTVEWSEATTTQMYSLQQKDWARTLLRAVDIPIGILPPVTPPGTLLSPVRSDIIEECGLLHSFPAIAVGSHDTASAVAAIPNMTENSVFLASGTWSLMGVETSEANTSEEALRLGFTNEGGVDGSVLLVKNITGLWIVQECLRQWIREGHNYTWSEMMSAAGDATPFRYFIDPDAPQFATECDMPRAIHDYCVATGQQAAADRWRHRARCI